MGNWLHYSLNHWSSTSRGLRSVQCTTRMLILWLENHDWVFIKTHGTFQIYNKVIRNVQLDRHTAEKGFLLLINDALSNERASFHDWLNKAQMVSMTEILMAIMIMFILYLTMEHVILQMCKWSKNRLKSPTFSKKTFTSHLPFSSKHETGGYPSNLYLYLFVHIILSHLVDYWSASREKGQLTTARCREKVKVPRWIETVLNMIQLKHVITASCSYRRQIKDLISSKLHKWPLQLWHLYQETKSSPRILLGNRGVPNLLPVKKECQVVASVFDSGDINTIALLEHWVFFKSTTVFPNKKFCSPTSIYFEENLLKLNM